MSSDWQIILLASRNSLLKKGFKASFGEKVIVLNVPELGKERKNHRTTREDLLSYFRRHVYDSGIWRQRILTVYGSGSMHHYTFALHKLALQQRTIRKSTLMLFDQHRDTWGRRNKDGLSNYLTCSNWFDQTVCAHNATPFMVGPDCYPAHDSRGFEINGNRIPVYHNYFTKTLQASRKWRSNTPPANQTGYEMPAVADLRETPRNAYLTFDLDLLGRSEIITEFDQNDGFKLRRLLQIIDQIRKHKRIFSADMLGFPEWNQTHSLSVLTMLILARKIMGLGINRLLEYHTHYKRVQGQLAKSNRNFYRAHHRQSPIGEEDLLEIVNG